MPDSDTAGYLTDVAYPAHFHRETLPAWLVSTATALGHAAPALEQPYTWMDLGCGAGLGVLLAAAANPTGRFIGVDVSAREIDRAQRTAALAGLANAQFVCVDINDSMATQALPPCEFIVTHGLYSWVDAQTRARVASVIHHHLKPGGIAYVAYMSQPGSAAFAAARKLLQMTAAQAPGDSAARARAGMQYLQALARAGAGFFIEHPAAHREVLQADAREDAYLAHELLNDDWHALHVADVIADFAAGGCAYLGSATLLDNIDSVSLPRGVQPLLEDLRRQAAPIAQQETLRDLARNQNLRRDLYQRGAPARADHRLDADAHRRALLAQQVGLLPAAPSQWPASGELVLETRIGPVTLPWEHVRPLLAALADASRSYAHLAALPAYRAQPGFVNSLLQVLAWAGWVHYHPAAGTLPAPAATQLAQRVLADAGYGDWQILPGLGTAVPRGASPSATRRPAVPPGQCAGSALRP